MDAATSRQTASESCVRSGSPFTHALGLASYKLVAAMYIKLSFAELSAASIACILRQKADYAIKFVYAAAPGVLVAAASVCRYVGTMNRGLGAVNSIRSVV